MFFELVLCVLSFFSDFKYLWRHDKNQQHGDTNIIDMLKCQNDMESEVVLSHFLGVMGRWAVTVEQDKQGIKDSKSLGATLTTDI